MAAPLLVFDLDGTLVDSAPDLLATLDAILPRHGFAAASTTDAARRHRPRRAPPHRIRAAPAARRRSTSATLDAMHRDFLDHYEANICVETRLYPGR